MWMRTSPMKRFRSTNEGVEEQGGGLRKGVMEKPPSGGSNMGGRGRYEASLSSSLCKVWLVVPINN